jgi:ankyrin repeat protein
VQAALSEQPDLLHSTEAIFEAARRDRADVVAMLLDLGASPNVADDTNQRPLHIAAYANAVNVASLLLSRGADIDPVESNWNNTPLSAAIYAQRQPMIELLGRVSRDVFNLTYAGNVARLRDLLAEDASHARLVVDDNTPLMWLPPDDEARAIEIARLLLANGADPTVVSRRGLTAADFADKLGMADLATLLRAAAGGQFLPAG